MQIKNTLERYGLIAILFHWITALLVVGLLCVGLYMADLKISSLKLRLFGLHKEFGLLVLFLVMGRLGWRFMSINPALPLTVPLWQKLAAHAVQWMLIGCMVAMPMTGWLLTSAAGLAPSFFGWFVMPPLIAPNDALRHLFAEIHQWIAYGFIALICAHVGAALKHHYIDNDDVLRRMLP
jgi:cytochrome b561